MMYEAPQIFIDHMCMHMDESEILANVRFLSVWTSRREKITLPYRPSLYYLWHYDQVRIFMYLRITARTDFSDKVIFYFSSF